MKENKESIKDVVVRVKDSFTLRQLAAVFVIIFGVAANILSDYLTAGFDASIYSDPAYWINLAISQGAVIVIMLCMYSLMSEREEQGNEAVGKLRQDIYKAHCLLTRYGLAEKFDDYVYVQNISRKKRAYTRLMERKIFRAKTDKKRAELKAKLDEGLKIIESLRVRYNKIRISTIFSRASLPCLDDENLDDGNARTTRRMLLNKIVGIISFGVLLSSLTFDARTFGLGLVVKTFIKLFQAAYAMFAGGNEGVHYVRGPLLSALDNRAAFIQKFLDRCMPTPEEKRNMDENAKTEEIQAAEDILSRKKEIEKGAECYGVDVSAEKS